MSYNCHLKGRAWDSRMVDRTFLIRFVVIGHKKGLSPVHTYPDIFESIKNIRIRCRIPQMCVDGSRIRKEKVADSKIFRYVRTER